MFKNRSYSSRPEVQLEFVEFPELMQLVQQSNAGMQTMALIDSRTYDEFRLQHIVGSYNFDVEYETCEEEGEIFERGIWIPSVDSSILTQAVSSLERIILYDRDGSNYSQLRRCWCLMEKLFPKVKISVLKGKIFCPHHRWTEYHSTTQSPIDFQFDGSSFFGISSQPLRILRLQFYAPNLWSFSDSVKSLFGYNESSQIHHQEMKRTHEIFLFCKRKESRMLFVLPMTPNELPKNLLSLVCLFQYLKYSLQIFEITSMKLFLLSVVLLISHDQRKE